MKLCFFSAGTTFSPGLTSTQASNETCVPYVDPNISTGSNLAFYQVRTYMLFSPGFPKHCGPRTAICKFACSQFPVLHRIYFWPNQRRRMIQIEINDAE